MIIGINLLFLIPNKVGGSEPFTRGIIKALTKYDRKNSYFLFCNNENYSTFSDAKNIKRVKININATNKPLRLIAEQFLFWFYIKKYKIKALHSYGYISPFFVPCINIVNIFDLNWYYHPENFSRLEYFVWKFFVTNSAKFADGITTSSYSSKNSIKKVLKTKKPIDVVYPGIFDLDEPYTYRTLRKKGIGRPYFFTLTSAHPHKNAIGLLKSFNLLVKTNKSVQLVIAGLGGKAKPLMEEFISKNNLLKSVKMLGYIDNRLMATLYKYCHAFVFTSKYEGFGVPILECFKLGVPIISTNAFSLKEVVGKGGITLEPDDQKGFAREMEKVLSSNRYRKKLSIRAKSNAKRFDWRLTVNTINKIYNKYE